MPLISERLYDPQKPLYFSGKTRFAGRDYQKGDEAPVKDMSQRTVLKFFRTGLFVHSVREVKGVVTEGTQESEQVSEELSAQDSSEERSEAPVVEEKVEVVAGEVGSDLAAVVEDTEESFKVKYKGEVREIKRNQIRDSGELTTGGLKAFS